MLEQTLDPRNADLLQDRIAPRWLENTAPSPHRTAGEGPRVLSSEGASRIGGLFYEHLLETMHDGVVFVDVSLRIVKWNRAIELLTGIAAANAEQQLWDPAMLQLRDEHYKLIKAEQCPVARAIREGNRSCQRVLVTDSKQEKISIDAYITPVVGADGAIHGATLLLQDASSRISLEERLQRLNEKATQDGLTGIANRAEFDRAHERCVTLHQERGRPYSLIICDLDHFKRINDTNGHQAGDEALIAFATLLRQCCRGGDMVARYGGDEFVVLCEDCDSDAAAERAETMRDAWSRHPLLMLNGKCLTASFGVSGLQTGDTGETMLRRADRALLQAKSEGRNTVVMLGGGTPEPQAQERRGWHWLWSWKQPPGQHLLQRRVVTVVPLHLATEKLRGFIADHGAEIVEIAKNRVVLEIAGRNLPLMRRSSDRPTPFLVELNLEEVHADHAVQALGSQLRTLIQITVRPKRQRDRRRLGVDERARYLFLSLKSYLMAQDYPG